MPSREKQWVLPKKASGRQRPTDCAARDYKVMRRSCVETFSGWGSKAFKSGFVYKGSKRKPRSQDGK